MLVRDWLTYSTSHLEIAGVGTARLDALVLLEDVTGIDRGRLLAEPKFELTSTQVSKLEKLLKRRAEHEPLAYVRGKTEFYGREFVITPAVLEPRPESETMIDLLKQLHTAGKLTVSKDKLLRLADVGTGSGALGITVKLELAGVIEATVDLLEIDRKAAAVAQMNVDKYTTDVRVIISDLLDDSSQDYDVLLCNLPYVPDGYTINNAALCEPKLAIFGGPDGLNLYRQLFKQIGKLKKRPLFILTEALPPQHLDLAAIAREHSYLLLQSDDFIQVFQFR